MIFLESHDVIAVVESFLERTKLDSSMVPSPFLMGRHDAQIWDFNKKILTQVRLSLLHFLLMLAQ